MLDEIETNSAIVGGVAIGILVVMVSMLRHQNNRIINLYYRIPKIQLNEFYLILTCIDSCRHSRECFYTCKF